MTVRQLIFTGKCRRLLFVCMVLVLSGKCFGQVPSNFVFDQVLLMSAPDSVASVSELDSVSAIVTLKLGNPQAGTVLEVSADTLGTSPLISALIQAGQDGFNYVYGDKTLSISQYKVTLPFYLPVSSLQMLQLFLVVRTNGTVEKWIQL